MEILTDLNNFIEKDIYINSFESYFKKLNTFDKDILKKYYKNLLITIYFAFFANNTNLEVFKEKMSQNNFSDSVAILLLLLPFINSSEDTNEITSFNDMVKKKYKDINIKEITPKYVYTNFQYHRCDRKTISEINFEEDYLKHNYYFLINTIKQMSNKLYINWFDVIPYNMVEYQNDKLFKNTKKLFTESRLKNYDYLEKADISIDEQYIENLQCLSIGDLYETFTNELFYQVKKVKWLIYDIYVDNLKQPIPLVLALNQMLRNTLIQNINVDWENLPLEGRELFAERWNNILNLAKTNSNYDIGIFTINSFNLKKVLKSIAIFFNNHYKDIERLVERGEYKLLSFELSQEDIEEAEEDLLENIKFSQLRNTLSNIKLEHIYKFIRDSLELLKLSWYSIKLFDKDKEKLVNLKDYTSIYPYDAVTKVTIKNIYNFSKSLCHIDHNSKFTPLPRFWQSLTDQQKNIIEQRIYNTTLDVMSWFNISRNLKDFNIKNLKYYHDNLFAYLKSNMIEIMFESFISRGILSKLVPSLHLTNTQNIPTDKRPSQYPPQLNKTVFKTDDSNKIYTDSYYFLTSSTYKAMPLINYMKGSSNVQTHYFNWNGSTDCGAWYVAYALDWICQINFFNKFINNRVMYVTGATGAGKSTQVPKLLLYGQKAVLYNSLANVVCTQPRKTPTSNNAERVSLEMGVPLSVELKRNYYVQYKHKDTKHVKNTNHLNLKYITDGSLSMEVNNPVLRKDPHYVQNLYDIVIVDEAHEHNANMDFILTLMKFIALYNNTIKLVIVSATMDDDEPTYRRYYRDINDNKMYPLNFSLRKNTLDRINIDRRFHMSPPGKSTRFKIIDTYIEDIPKAQQDPTSLAIELVRTKPSGFILIFQPGSGEIEKLIEDLNKKLPDDTIAIPYHSLLKKPLRDFVEKISDKYTELALDKDTKFSELENPTWGSNKGKYKRVIIVATNVAEASITINKLRYVIETGTQKTAKYDYSKRNTRLVLDTISDSSRLQRRGRVGRVAPGEVYYLYKKGTTENIKTIYNMCIQDISQELYRRLFNSSLEKKLFTLKTDPNNPENKFTLSDLPILYGQFYKNFEYYFNLDTYFDYVGNLSHYDYINYTNPGIYFESGYSIYNLNDYDGDFFIIHPEEIYIKRNIVGTIMENTSKSNKLERNKLDSEKLKVFWESLKNDYFLDYDETKIIKLDLGEKFQRLQEIFGFEDPKLFKTLMFSYIFGVQEEVIRLVSLLQVMPRYTDSLLEGYILNGKYMKPFDDLKKLIGEGSRGDLDGLTKILDIFHKMLNTLNVQYDNDMTFTKKILMADVVQYILKHKTSDQQQRVLKEFGIDVDKINNFSYLTEDDYNNFRKSDYILEFEKKSFLDNFDEIFKFTRTYKLNYNTLKAYFEKYCQIKNTLYLYKNKCMDSQDIKYDEYNLLDELTKVMGRNILSTNFDNYEKVLSCFLLSNPYNIVTSLDSNNFIYFYEPTNENIYKVSTISKNSPKLDTVIDPVYMKKYLYYQQLDIDKESISMINSIHPKLFENLYSIYNLTDFGKKINGLLKTDYKDGKVQSSIYKSKLMEIIGDIKDTSTIVNINVKKNTNIDKINFFNKKIKEIMS